MATARALLAILMATCLTNPSPAAVIVVGNYTLQPVILVVTQAEGPAQTVRLESLQLSPITVSGAVDVTFPTRTGNTKLRLEPSNAYVLLQDEKTGVRMEGIAQPGDPLAEDTKPGEGLAPKRVPYKYPVTLYVDDTDPRNEKFWQAALRQRFEEAAETVAKHSGIQFELKGFGTWNASPEAFEPTGMLADFEKKVRIRDGELAIGYTSRKVEDKPEIPFGACRGALSTHLLMREGRPKNEAERVEALTHFLGQAAGAVLSPDPGSAMRAKIANGLAISAKYQVRFDPLNTLAMSLWAEELRKGPRLTLADVAPANKARLSRVYKALAAAMPDDKLATNYATEFDNAMAAVRPKVNPMAGDPPAVVEPARSGRTPLQEATRQVLLGIVARADLNTRAPSVAAEGELVRLQGDRLTEAYIRAAADAAWTVEEQFRPDAFLMGLGIALDDAGLLRSDSVMESFVKAVESETEREKRLALLGQPTLRSRRDLCRRFAAAGAMTNLLGASAAQQGSVKVALAQAARPTGFSFPALAADLAGLEFAQQVKGRPELIAKWRGGVNISEALPAMDSLREGISPQRFERDFGDPSDPRFTRVLDEIRERIAKLPAYR